jgi:hypothetical protein
LAVTSSHRDFLVWQASQAIEVLVRFLRRGVGVFEFVFVFDFVCVAVSELVG